MIEIRNREIKIENILITTTILRKNKTNIVIMPNPRCFKDFKKDNQIIKSIVDWKNKKDKSNTLYCFLLGYENYVPSANDLKQFSNGVKEYLDNLSKGPLILQRGLVSIKKLKI